VEDKAKIETTIDYLRGEMVRTYEKVGDLSNEAVIALSQKLDVYLVMYQQFARISQE
jgi:Spo0E like sporulation regulatory protein